MTTRFPDYYDKDVKITDFYLKNDLPQIRHSLYRLKEYLLKSNIDMELIRLILNGLSLKLQKKKFSTNDATYIHSIVNEFIRTTDLQENVVIEILIKFNYNQPHFYLYLTKKLGNQLIEICGLHEQKEMVLQQKDEVKRIDARFPSGLHPSERHIKDEIVQFYAEKSTLLDELMALRRITLTDKYESEKAFRMLVGLTVPQLALFFRIQMECGLLAKEGITEVYNFVAQHFYTEKTIFISSQNLLRRSTNVEFSTAVKLWEILTKMLEWLDTNFSVKNYQRAMSQ